MSKKKCPKHRIILASGGTGGHIFPAQALAEKLSSNYELSLITDTRGQTFLTGILAQIPKTILKVKPPSGSLNIKIANTLGLVLSTIHLYFKFLRTRPNLVIGFGGYPSFPPIAAAVLLNIPIIIHEQNAFMGAVNKLFALFSHKIAVSFEQTLHIPKKAQHKVVHTGNPVRSAIEQTAKRKPIQNAKGFSIVVIGGSQGAGIFGNSIPQALGQLDPDMQSKIKIYHQVRANLQQEIEEEYEKTKCIFDLKPFYTNIADLMYSCDLIIARAGASTIAEIIALAKPAILVPFAAAANNHQWHNAANLVRIGSAILAPEKDFNASYLAQTLALLINEPESIFKMQMQAKTIQRSDAAEQLHILVKSVL